MDLNALKAAIAAQQAARPTQVQNTGLSGLDNLKRQLNGQVPVDGVPVGTPPAGAGLTGGGPIKPGTAFPMQSTDGDAMSGQVAAMQAANAAKAAQDPMMAQKLAATQAAVQQFRAQQEAPQVQQLQAIAAARDSNLAAGRGGPIPTFGAMTPPAAAPASDPTASVGQTFPATTGDDDEEKSK